MIIRKRLIPAVVLSVLLLALPVQAVTLPGGGHTTSTPSTTPQHIISAPTTPSHPAPAPPASAPPASAPPASAEPAPAESAAPGTGEGTGEGTGTGTGTGTGSGGGSCACSEQYEAYIPKVTELHSLNAKFASSNYDVYFVPKLEDFPFNLPNASLNLTETLSKKDKQALDDKVKANNNVPPASRDIEHKFAIVCGEYFDSEVDLVAADADVDVNAVPDPSGSVYQARTKTSKKVYSKEDNSRLLNLIGYDLLLSSEKAVCMSNGDDTINCEYYATKVGTSDITVKTLVMDLYKCLGVEEFDTTYVFCRDPNFDVNQSHVLSHLSVLTSAKEGDGGCDISENNTWVFATRTNPDIYWSRAKKDALFDGGIHNITSDKNFVGSECAVSKSFSANQTMTLSEFLTLARAMMTLYGEPVVLDSEMRAAKQLYGTALPKGCMSTEEEEEAVWWCAAKGLIDPRECDWTGYVNFADIEPVLLRIADTSARLNPVDSADFSTELSAAGYRAVNVAVNPNISTEVYDLSTEDWFDYLIEYRDKDTERTAVRVLPYTNHEDTENLSTWNNVHLTTSADPGSTPGTSTTNKESPEIVKPSDPALYASNMMVKFSGEFRQVKWANDSTVDNVNAEGEKLGIDVYSGNYKYFGIETYTVNGKEKKFYHFKISQDALKEFDGVFGYNVFKDSVKEKDGTTSYRYYLCTDSEGNNRIGMQYDISEFSIASNGDYKLGGVFTYSAKKGKWQRKEFTKAGFSHEFIDSETNTMRNSKNEKVYKKTSKKSKDKTALAELKKIYASNEAKILAVTCKAANINADATFITAGNNSYDMTKLFTADKRLIESGKTVSVGGSTPTFCTVIQSAANEDWVRFEFYSTDIEPIRSTAFYTELGCKAGTDSENCDGFYQTEDNSLLVSYNYLQSKGVVSGYTELKDKAGFAITCANTGSNVILYDKKNGGNRTRYIMVGDTLYTNFSEDEALFTEDNGLYINYRAVIGWANNYVAATTDADGLVATPVIDYQSSQAQLKQLIAKHTVQMKLPSSTLNVPTLTLKRAGSVISDIDNSMMATGSYALSPYLFVVDCSSASNDKLFVWHKNKVVSPVDMGTEVTMSSAKNASNCAAFTSLTGIKCEEQSDYSLAMFKLDHKKRSNSKNPKGIIYTNVVYNTRSAGNKYVTYGYVYNPPSYKLHRGDSGTDFNQHDSGFLKAIDAYIQSATDTEQEKANHKDTLALPIIAYGNNWYDVNFNTCSPAPNEKQLPVGTLPTRVIIGLNSGSSDWNKFTRVQPDGNINRSVPGADINNNNEAQVDNVVMYTAPVAMFAKLRALGEMKASEVTSGTLYYGTSIAEVNDGAVTITNNKTSFSADSNAICTYKGIANTSVYAVTDSYSAIGGFVDAIESKLAVAYKDPKQLVDWGAYKFSRLIKNVDNWSSIVLIFVLNVLPRIFMLLFFVLMLLALISDVKPWKKFNQKTFDVYKFLTFGHISVDSVDMKRLVITSLVCMSIFLMIMDGQLFNFIIWICKFGIALYQH